MAIGTAPVHLQENSLDDGQAIRSALSIVQGIFLPNAQEKDATCELKTLASLDLNVDNVLLSILYGYHVDWQLGNATGSNLKPEQSFVV